MAEIEREREVHERGESRRAAGRSDPGLREDDRDDEQTLLALLRNGDSEGLKRTMEKYHGRLFSVAIGICRNPADTEEVLQDVYWTAFRKIDRFQEMSTLGTWLHRITVNASLMKIRSQKKTRNTFSMEEWLASPGEDESERCIGGATPSPSDSLMARELCEIIWESARALPEIYQEVFVLRDLHGYTIKETSRVLNVTPSAIKSRSRRGRILVKKEVTGCGL